VENFLLVQYVELRSAQRIEETRTNTELSVLFTVKLHDSMAALRSASIIISFGKTRGNIARHAAERKVRGRQIHATRLLPKNCFRK
jgi:hypothetical protein